jgi:hypothetical protein
MRQSIGKLIGFTVTLVAVLSVAQAGHASAHFLWTPQPGVNSPQIPDSQAAQMWPCVDRNGAANGGRSNALAVWISANKNGADTPDYVDNVQVPSGTTSIAMTYNYAGVNCQGAPPRLGSQEFRSIAVNVTSPPGTSVGALQPPGAAGRGDLLFANFQSCDALRGCYLRNANNFTFSKPGGFTKSGKYTIAVDMKQVNHYAVASGGQYECINKANDQSKPLVISGFDKWNSCNEIPLSLAINVTVISTNNPPTGAIGCKAASGACCTIHVDFSDRDGPTEARLLKDGAFYKTLTFQPVDVDVSPDVPYSTATFTLQVRNRVSDADGGSPTNGAWTTILGADGQPISVTSGPCAPNPTCAGANAAAGSPEVGAPFELDASFAFTGSGPPNPTYTISVNGQSWAGPPDAGASYTPSAGSGVIKVPNVTINTAGKYPVTYTLSYSGPPIRCSGSISVFSKPYFKVLGGDVAVGGGVPSVDPLTFLPSCDLTRDVNTSAIVASWNKRDSDYNGAGAQYAVRALLGITDFASSQGGPGAPTALSFANQPATIDVPNGKFGGYFGNSGAPPCNKAIITNALATSQADTIPIPGTTGIDSLIPAGNATYVVKGRDVHINANITYANTSNWGTNVANIPNFRLVVLGGNIYIAPGVTNLDGLYYAAPDTATPTRGGQIVTCAMVGAVDDTLLSDKCGLQLTVNGSFMAKRVLLLRTAGTLRNAPGAAAEVFHYSPEQWISTGGGSGRNDAYTSLPPVL